MVFTKSEVDGLTAEQTHEAFRMLCDGASVDTIRATILGEKKEEPKPSMTQQQCQDKAMELARKMAESNAAAQRAMTYYLRRR